MYGFGPSFFGDDPPPLAVVEMDGVFNYRQPGAVEYRPHPPWPGQMTLMLELENGTWFYRGGPVFQRQTRNPLALLGTGA